MVRSSVEDIIDLQTHLIPASVFVPFVSLSCHDYASNFPLSRSLDPRYRLRHTHDARRCHNITTNFLDTMWLNLRLRVSLPLRHPDVYPSQLEVNA